MVRRRVGGMVSGLWDGGGLVVRVWALCSPGPQTCGAKPLQG